MVPGPESHFRFFMVLSAHLSPENRAAYEALAVDAMVSKPFDVHELRATITQLANGIKPGVGENPVQLSPAALRNMLKTALDGEEQPDEAIGGAPERLQEHAERTELRLHVNTSLVT